MNEKEKVEWETWKRNTH